MTPLNLGHFRITGWQDCNNACDLRELRERGLDSIRAEMDACRAEWIAQMAPEDYEGLDPVTCYEAWRDAWIETAREILARYPEERYSND